MILALEKPLAVDFLPSLSEKIHASWAALHGYGINPVVETCKFAYKVSHCHRDTGPTNMNLTVLVEFP